MMIGYDAKRIVRNGTGLGSYSRTLVNDLARNPDDLQLHLYAPDEGRDDLRSQVLPGVNWHFSRSKPGLYSGQSWLWRTWGIVNDLKRDGIQLYHGLSGELPIGIHRSGIKSVVTIHDLIFLRHPEYYHWLDTKIYDWKFRQTIREADHIIAISECTKRDIIELGGVDERKISIIYQSCAPRFSGEFRVESLEFPTGFQTGSEPSTNSRAVARSAEGRLLPEGRKNSTLYTLNSKLPYILSVGSIEERKNIMLAVKALPYLPEDLHLVVVGRHTSYTDQVTDYANRHGLSHRLHILHGVTDEQLPALYAQAECFVYPSRYEGFGIPIIEAISSGLPVVACTGSCLEEAGGPDSLYVSPDDAEGLAAAIRQMLRGSDGREERIARSQAYIRRFEGRHVASQLIDLYHRLI